MHYSDGELVSANNLWNNRMACRRPVAAGDVSTAWRVKMPSCLQRSSLHSLLADRSVVAGDLICVIELLLLVVVVVGDAGRAALHAIFISITRPASSFSAYLVV